MKGPAFGLLLALAAAVGVWWLLERSTIGFRLRAVGTNPDAAKAAGMGVAATYMLTMALAGSLAGKEILDDVAGNYSPVWVGTVAGIASAILMSMLMITYHMEAQRG